MTLQRRYGEKTALDEIGYSGTYNFELTLTHYGKMLDEATRFLGRFLGRFVDGAL